MSIDQRSRAEVIAEQEANRADFNAAAATINAAEAERQASRANVFAVHNTRQAEQIDATRRQRDEAIYEGAVARDRAHNASVFAWMFGGLLGALLIAGLIWMATRNSDSANTQAQTAPPVVTRTVVRERVTTVPASPQPAVTVVAPVVVRPAATPAPARAVVVPEPLPPPPVTYREQSAPVPATPAPPSSMDGAPANSTAPETTATETTSSGT